MDDNQKLQLIRLKVEELQGLSGTRQSQDQCDGPDDDNLINDDVSTDLSGRKRRRRHAMAVANQPQAPQAAGQPEAPPQEGMGDTGGSGFANSPMAPVLGLVGLASSGLSAYHGYRRNDSVGWGIGWGVLGALFPVITPAIAFAQGFGQPIGKSFGHAANPSDFLLFCRNATDSQLEAILEKEWEGAKRDPDRQSDYEDAEREAERRGWSVSRGRRL